MACAELLVLNVAIIECCNELEVMKANDILVTSRQLIASWLNQEHGITFRYTEFLAKNLEFPSKDDNFDLIVIGGSRSNTTDDLPWVHTLRENIRNLRVNRLNQRIYGICFGAQIVTEALGGKVGIISTGVFELGRRKLELIKNNPLKIDPRDNLGLYVVHGLQILEPPAEAQLVATGEGVIYILEDSETQNRFFCVQHHPEHPRLLMDLLTEANVGKSHLLEIDANLAKSYMRRRPSSAVTVDSEGSSDDDWMLETLPDSRVFRRKMINYFFPALGLGSPN